MFFCFGVRCAGMWCAACRTAGDYRIAKKNTTGQLEFDPSTAKSEHKKEQAAKPALLPIAVKWAKL